MKRALLTGLTVSLLPLSVAALPTPLYTTTVTIRLTDPIDRRVFGVGVKPEQFYFSFNTQYRISGRDTPANVWWRAARPGMTLQVKAIKRVGFWWATAANLQRGDTP